MVKNRIFYIIALIGLLLFYMYCNSYTPLTIIVVFASLTVFGVIAAILSKGKISMEIKPIHPFATQAADQRAEFCTTIKNDSIFPVSAVTFELEFQDMSDSGFVKRKIKTPVAAKEERKIHTFVTTSHASLIECRIRKPRIYDAFGIMHFRIKNIREKNRLLITPVMPEESYIRASRSSSIIDSDKYSETQKGDDSSQVFEVRNYVPGDDIRRIHWRLSSKQDDLIVKEYSKPIEENCAVILETGLGSTDNEERKLRSDGILSAFMRLSSELIENEQSFSVYWYSGAANRLVSFDVKTYDDVAPLIEKFLSEKFELKKNITLYMSEGVQGEFLDKQVYYLYDSSFCDNETVAQAEEKYFIVDTASRAETKVKSRG